MKIITSTEAPGSKEIELGSNNISKSNILLSIIVEIYLFFAFNIE